MVWSDNSGWQKNKMFNIEHNVWQGIYGSEVKFGLESWVRLSRCDNWVKMVLWWEINLNFIKNIWFNNCLLRIYPVLGTTNTRPSLWVHRKTCSRVVLLKWWRCQSNTFKISIKISMSILLIYSVPPIWKNRMSKIILKCYFD